MAPRRRRRAQPRRPQTRIDDRTITGPELTAPGGRAYAAGDRVVMLSPGERGSHVTSERATVIRVDGESLAIRFDDGRPATLTGRRDQRRAPGSRLRPHRAPDARSDRRPSPPADGGGRELTYVAMSRAKETTHVHVVADDLDQAVDDLTREWSTERRQRWIIDTDVPATEAHPQRPGLAKRPSLEHRRRQVEPEASALEETAAAQQQAKVDQITRRLDALQHRRPTRGRGLEIR